MTGAAQTYAGALYDLARDEQKQDPYMQAMLVLRELLEQQPDITELLSSHAIPLAQRLETAELCFSSLADRDFLNFLKLLCQRDLIRRLPECIRHFETLYNAEHGIVEAVAVSAAALSPEQFCRLQSRLEQITGKTVHLRNSVDPALLGGVRLELEGRELDGSVRRALEQIAEQLKTLTL